MRYEVYGPFCTPRVQAEADGIALRFFWNEIEKMHSGLSRAIGIYIFSTLHGNTYTPWYVGKTNAKQGFRGEVFQTHKFNHYINASQLKRGAPTLHLIAKLEPNRGNYCRASAQSGHEIDELEQ